MEIKNVIICGLGALGLTYADKLNKACNLKILANKERIEKYRKNAPIFNNKVIELEYITPDSKFDADLIIISTKSTGLDFAIKYIKNFVTDNTIIISLINGISSEEKIASIYPNTKVLRSYFIGHSAIRTNNKITQDGVGKIVVEPNISLEKFLSINNIDYEVVDDIVTSQWIKLGVNIILNQLSAIYKCSVGELRAKDEYLYFAKNLIKEIKEVAIAHGVQNIENFEKQVLESANLVNNEGKTSMYQDMIANRKTEVDIFSGEIIKLGNFYNIKTPFNKDIYNRIKLLESKF